MVTFYTSPVNECRSTSLLSWKPKKQSKAKRTTFFLTLLRELKSTNKKKPSTMIHLKKVKSKVSERGKNVREGLAAVLQQTWIQASKKLKINKRLIFYSPPHWSLSVAVRLDQSKSRYHRRPGENVLVRAAAALGSHCVPRGCQSLWGQSLLPRAGLLHDHEK